VRSLPGVSFLPINLRPGRGVAWAYWHWERAGQPEQRMLLLGLPGNAVAGGAEAPLPEPLWLPISADLHQRAGRIDFRRARLVRIASGATALHVLPEQGSAMIRTVSEADALVAVGPAAEFRAGALLPCYLLAALGGAGA
jgi:molybdopterin biosynthesis enzyme